MISRIDMYGGVLRTEEVVEAVHVVVSQAQVSTRTGYKISLLLLFLT